MAPELMAFSSALHFVSRLPSRVAAIESAIDKSDRGELVTLAHQLAGAAGAYGFPDISDVAGQLELDARGDAAFGSLLGNTKLLADSCRQAGAVLPHA